MAGVGYPHFDRSDDHIMAQDLLASGQLAAMSSDHW